jgi:hypothetical protein
MVESENLKAQIKQLKTQLKNNEERFEVAKVVWEQGKAEFESMLEVLNIQNKELGRRDREEREKAKRDRERRANEARGMRKQMMRRDKM